MQVHRSVAATIKARLFGALSLGQKWVAFIIMSSVGRSVSVSFLASFGAFPVGDTPLSEPPFRLQKDLVWRLSQSTKEQVLRHRGSDALSRSAKGITTGWKNS